MTDLKISTMDGNGTFDDVIAESSSVVQEIAKAARELIAEVYPGVVEVPWGHQKIAGYGVGPKKMSEQFCYIAPFKAYVNLGFYYGADLPDPDGLMEGSGKALRHIKIRSLEALRRDSVKTLVVLASQHLPKLGN